jgi:hypothetical protein
MSGPIGEEENNSESRQRKQERKGIPQDRKSFKVGSYRLYRWESSRGRNENGYH